MDSREKQPVLKNAIFSVKFVPYFSSAEGFEQLTDCARMEMSREEALLKPVLLLATSRM